MTRPPAGPTGNWRPVANSHSTTYLPWCWNAPSTFSRRLGCALIGAQLPWSRTGHDACWHRRSRRHRRDRNGHTASPPAAAVLNGTFVQGFDSTTSPHRAGAQLLAVIRPSCRRRSSLPTSVAPTRCWPRIVGSRSGTRRLPRCTAPKCSTAVGIPDRCSAPHSRRWRRASPRLFPGQLETRSGWPRPSRQA